MGEGRRAPNRIAMKDPLGMLPVLGGCGRDAKNAKSFFKQKIAARHSRNQIVFVKEDVEISHRRARRLRRPQSARDKLRPIPIRR
jgi:hypothetical protein